MAEDTKELTPHESGTDESLTPPVGTDSGRQLEESSEPDHPAYRKLKDRYAGSTQEAQRLFQENLNLRNQLQQQYQQQQYQPQQPQYPQDDNEVLTKEEADALSDAYIDKNHDVIQKMEKLKAYRIAEKTQRWTVQQIGENAAHHQRLQAAFGYIQSIPELRNPEHPLSRKTLQRYQQITMDPVNCGWVPPVNVEIAPGVRVNPFLFRIAVTETKAELNEGRSESHGKAAADYFVEPSGKTAPPPKSDFNPMKHLSASERDYVDRQRNRIPDYNYKKYWESWKPEMREARLKAGKPLREVRGSFIE